ncbi:MAG TPA: hypothetical protein VNS19_06205 [Acidimicrobiales bacterium]|nr:hypothetical protein [Acidimicrobiales bacterium]
MRAAAVVGAAVLLLGGATAATAAPRTPSPPPPVEREETIPFDVDAFAHSLADLPDPLPDPPDDGTYQTCIDVPARPSAYPLFDGATLEVPPSRDAELCAIASPEGPNWTLAWHGVIQDPDVAGTGGMRAWGLWVLIGDGDGWLAAMGNLDEGAQYVYEPVDWGGQGVPMTQLHIEGRYLDRSRFTTTSQPPLVVETTAAPSTTSTTAVAASGTAAPAQPVAGAPGYTG